MAHIETIIKPAYAALERHPDINLHKYPIDITIQDDKLVLAGEIESIAAKRIAVHTLDKIELYSRSGRRTGAGAVADITRRP